ncbi:MAG: efflux RND transporter periplasmic adaptor subunit [Planctomycetes bacterium]|nr:efflux RND transporter periplasmic adaptor subunit [Planctomycetota bacterium]
MTHPAPETNEPATDLAPPQRATPPLAPASPAAGGRAARPALGRPTGKDWAVVGGVLLIATGMALLRPSKGGPGAGTEVEVVTLRRGDVVATCEAPGTVRAGSETGVGAPFEGKVMLLEKDEGDEVKQGDVLFRLDPQEREEALEEARLTHARNTAALAESQAEADEAQRLLREVEREPSDLVESRLRERQSKLQLERTQTELQAATTRHQRAKLMLEERIGTEIDVETARDSVEVAENAQRIAQAELRLAEETIRFRERTWAEDKAAREKDAAIALRRLERAKADRDSSAVALERAQRDAERCTIRSPLDGIVTGRGVNLGDQVSRATGDVSHYIVSDLRALVVYVDVDEGEVVAIAPEQPAKVTVSAYPNDVFAGQVIDVGYRADTSSEVATFRVRVLLTEQHEGRVLRPGMSARVVIETARAEDVLRIPLQGLVQREVRELPKRLADQVAGRAPEALVDGFFVVVDGKTELVLLPPGIRDLEHAVAPPELAPATQVVIGPFSVLNGLKDGKRVQAKESKDFYPEEAGAGEAAAVDSHAADEAR